jgi:hypothetical protein
MLAVAREGSRRSAARAAENESTFRKANEQIQAKWAELALTEGLTPYLCECEEERCVAIVRLSIAEYEEVRSGPRQFLLAPGHEEDDDQVVSEQERFTVVEKTGDEGRLVEERDPRS